MVDLESCDKPKRKCGKKFVKQFDPQPLEPLNFTDRTGKLVWLRPTSLDDMLKLWENPAYQCVLRMGFQVVQSRHVTTHKMKLSPTVKRPRGPSHYVWKLLNWGGQVLYGRGSSPRSGQRQRLHPREQL